MRKSASIRIGLGCGILFMLGLGSAGASRLQPVLVQVSTVQNNDPAAQGKLAVDGQKQTRWSSEFSDPQWIAMDFGKPKAFDFVSLEWEAAFGKSYQLQVSQDGKKWKTIYEQERGSGGQERIFLGKQSARFFRLYGLERGTEWGYSLYEISLELLSDQKSPSPPQQAGVSRVGDVVFLDWQPNPEADIQGYIIYRRSNQADQPERRNPIICSKTHFQEQLVNSPTLPLYYLAAIDFSGNISQLTPAILRTDSSTQVRAFFSIPAAAWKRVLGDIPEASKSSSPNRGVALGGFGTGSFMYNLTGSFGPFQTVDNTLYQNLWLRQAAFHFYEKTGKQAVQAKTLAVNAKLMPEWPQLRIGDAFYSALQPLGWIAYHCFQHDLSLKFFSPIIPHDYQRSSYPTAIWEFKVKNPGTEPSEAAIMLTFPDIFVGKQIRTEKFTNTEISEGEFKGVRLTMLDQPGEWCIAARTTADMSFSYTTAWNADSDGSDVWKDFSDNGELNASRFCDDQKAAAIAVKIKLQPGEERIIPIAISWDFPIVKFGQGTEWWKKYARYFDRSGKNAFAIAKETLANFTAWEKKIDQWMQPVLASEQLPLWLKQAAFNELYYSQFGGSFYSSGLKSELKPGLIGKNRLDNKFFEMECIAYPCANTLDVRHYSSIVYALFWPEIEKSVLLDWADAIMEYDPALHQTPHDAGNPAFDPYYKWDNNDSLKTHWKDLHSKFIQECWRYWYLYHDREFLNYVWPACKGTYEFMLTTDQDGDGLPDNQGSDNTYDSWGLWGSSLLCGGLWVGALECMQKMAEIKQDPIETKVLAQLAKARRNLEEELWYAPGGYFKIDTKSKYPTAIMADGLNGQRYCEAWGLADILPAAKLRSHLQQVFQRCVKPLQDFTGDGIGDCGAINGMREDGKYLHQGQSDEVWTGTSYFLAALMAHAGLKTEALQTAYGVYYQTYVNEQTAYWFNTPEAWRDGGVGPRPNFPEQYQRPRAIWELVWELEKNIWNPTERK